MSWSRASDEDVMARSHAAQASRSATGRSGSSEGLRYRGAVFACIVRVSVPQAFRPARASAQTPAPVISVTFADAIRRAQESNPTVAAAAAGILRADGLVRQARAATLLQLSGNILTTTLNQGVEFAGQTVTPRN